MHDSGHAALHVVEQVTVEGPIAELVGVKFDNRFTFADEDRVAFRERLINVLPIVPASPRP